MTTFESLDTLAAVQREFDEYQRGYFPKRPPEFFALELAGEAGEVANNEKKQWKGRTVQAEQYADEAADVFIALMNYANARGIDLSSVVREKLRRIEEIRLRREAEGLPY